MTASKQSQDGTGSSILTLLGSGHQTCVKLTSAECTVENSWRWAEKMAETCEFYNNEFE